eukprot:1744229-Rhodomonas_salina.2
MNHPQTLDLTLGEPRGVSLRMPTTSPVSILNLPSPLYPRFSTAHLRPCALSITSLSNTYMYTC